MKVALLTSTRAEYGIYRPLLRALVQDPEIHVNIIAFGTHLSQAYGYTIGEIEADGFHVAYRPESMSLGDSPEALATAMGVTTAKFSTIWALEASSTDLIICLGDRYEMFAAVSAALPFNIPVAHLYGGETTLGAIDNKMRHALTMFADYHFTATEVYAEQVKRMAGPMASVFNVGSLSLDNLQYLRLLSPEEFQTKFGVDLRTPTLLVTFHPETVAVDQNRSYVRALLEALQEVPEQVLITMPNHDTLGQWMRQQFIAFAKHHPRVYTVENLGTQGYFSCMQHCLCLVGNTSSGIIEAASFEKYVVNLGNRQQGRACSDNVRHVPLEKEAILKALDDIRRSPRYTGPNVYYQPNVAERMCSILKSLPLHIH
ncbi:GDP/UDP-N,N'-diacetylbacillosamine 2-epimerase (hydrolysing) [Catalinimonas alkaloidigena]|uniref:GDP/UDP-N,N'-diacetylbacillosamine 2-epimerase (Hydrolysing) n=1 Tax=Catalinimonas alkaloidigena TaxID=1075417 RepID=A0A1G8ZK11_9BACT|nr:UDP-N-acetylglucosamine 2-epimerase [Catalinimonas alkaloidigena]SDK15397.1 GDP/UDP-N,N'-diacetylbacillosamine 2-epimerase (hydrolysing) [Catalinimonas alkaloidigena]